MRTQQGERGRDWVGEKPLCPTPNCDNATPLACNSRFT